MIRALACVALLIVAGCDPNFDVTVGVDLEDDCLLELPLCDSSGYWCGYPDAGVRRDCRVVCAAGMTLACTPSGPQCFQTVGGEMQNVPVTCVSNNG